MKIFENYSLKNLNTFHVDVLTKYFVEFCDIDELKNVLFNDQYKKLDKLILGSGSNILFTKDFDGVVLKNNLKGIEIVNEDDNFYYIKSASGEVWDDFVKYTINNNYNGLENLSLIPGTVGATVIQNVGAYGLETESMFYNLEAINIETGEAVVMNVDECKFGYRNSIFKNEYKNKFIIISVVFKLPKKPVFNIEYADIKKELEQLQTKELSSKIISDIVCSIRTKKLPNVDELGSAGSFFKNPEISRDKLNNLKANFQNIISYDLENGNVKLAAGWLIDQCGFKGKIFGNVGAYEKQALVIVNYGKATGEEIYNFSSNIIDVVNEKFGVILEREVNVI